MKYNITKLIRELDDAMIPYTSVGIGVEGKLVTTFPKDLSKDKLNQANLIISNHNPIWYVEQRRSAYPSIGDQLDMMYQDKKFGTATWLDSVEKVKKSIPKL